MKPHLPLFLATTLLFTACQDNKQESIKQLSGDVLALHDEIMPRSEELMNLKGELQKRVGEDSTARPTGDSLIAALDRADNGMSDWMSAYADANKDLQGDAALAFYEGEKVKLTRLKAETETSIVRAKEFLKTAPAK